jgi:hypothetical protein
MLDINENFEVEKSHNGGASNGSSKRGLVMNGTVIKPEPDKGNYIYLNKPHYLWVNLPDNGKYLLLIIELRYQQLQEKTHDPLAKLKQSSFIGSFEAEADFAENSENILHSLLSEKNDHC